MDETATHPRRYAKACDACYKKKIKCVYNERSCELCTKTGQPCQFTRMEKALPKRPRRGRYLAALEERMKQMETLLQRSQDNHVIDDNSSSQDLIERSVTKREMATTFSTYPINVTGNGKGSVDFHFPPKDEAIRLAQGYLATSNHIMPIFSGEEFMQRIKREYPPDRHDELLWWSSVSAVLCAAHRLRAMSSPAQAETENIQACRYLRELMEVAPRLTFLKPSLPSAQVLLVLASVLRGTPMPDSAPMLVAVAIRMLQDLDAHREEQQDSSSYTERRERGRAFWAAYILDKDIALTTRKPPVLSEPDITRLGPLDREEDGVGMIRSLDYYFETNLFAISQRLAVIQGQVWQRIYSAGTIANRSSLLMAQNELNPVLAAWKSSLEFGFKQVDLVGRWPKHAIVHIVVLHFRYFHTLVELNREPPMNKDEINPLSGDCPVAKSLPSYPHSTAPIAVDAARDALDLASLTPRGNFQNVWLFFEFSISAMLTLLVNCIVRPLNDYTAADLRRVDTWLRVIDILATSSERPDLLQKKEFLVHMRAWTLHVMQDTLAGRETECVAKQTQAYLDGTEKLPEDRDDEYLGMTHFGNLHPDVFPLDQLYVGPTREDWVDGSAIAWPYLIMPSS